MLQRNVSEEVSVRRRSEYKEWKKKVRELVDEGKMRVEEVFGRKLSERFMENRKLFCKEVKKERGDVGGVSLTMKREDGMLVSSKEEVQGVMKRHFEHLMNGGTGGEAVVTSMGMKAGGKRVGEKRTIERVEVEKAIGKMKCGNAAGIDGINPELVKHEGDTVREWMTMICDLAWRQGKVPGEWKKAVIVPLHKSKGNKDECNNYRGISLLSVPGKICGRILTERLMQVTEKKVSDEQEGFRKGKSCVDKYFAIKMLVEEYLGKDRKLYAAFMDLEKAYDRVDRRALWNIMKSYGVGGQLLEGIKVFL